MDGKFVSSKREAKIAVLFIQSLLVAYPVIVILGYYLENLQEIGIKELLFALLIILMCIGVIIGAFVMFIRWFYRAYSNLYEKTPDLKYKKRWVILCWLIPVINFYLPFLLIKNMYSNIAILTDNAAAKENLEKLTTINIWWMLYIVMWIFDLGYYALIYPGKSIMFNIITYILLIPSVWLTIKIIRNYCKIEEQLVDFV